MPRRLEVVGPGPCARCDADGDEVVLLATPDGDPTRVECVRCGFGWWLFEPGDRFDVPRLDLDP